MRNVPALLLVLATTACTSTQPASNPAAAPLPAGTPVTLTDAQRATIEAGVRSTLTTNPAGATFRTFIARTGTDGITMACGYVNAGSGDTPYVGTLTPTAFTVTGMGGTPERTSAVQAECQARRIYI